MTGINNFPLPRMEPRCSSGGRSAPKQKKTIKIEQEDKTILHWKEVTLFASVGKPALFHILIQNKQGKESQPKNMENKLNGSEMPV